MWDFLIVSIFQKKNTYKKLGIVKSINIARQ